MVFILSALLQRSVYEKNGLQKQYFSFPKSGCKGKKKNRLFRDNFSFFISTG